MLVNQVHEKLFEAAKITNHRRGSLKTHIRAGEMNCTSTDGLFCPSLRTKGITRLDQAFATYFEEETMDEGDNGQSPAYRRCEVAEWPDYLMLQLERWDFAVETGTRAK
jgi:hypothetical protein